MTRQKWCIVQHVWHSFKGIAHDSGPHGANAKVAQQIAYQKNVHDEKCNRITLFFHMMNLLNIHFIIMISEPEQDM